MSEHFIPFRKIDIQRLMLENHIGDKPFALVMTQVGAIFGQECLARLEQLKNLYQPLDPNCETLSIPDEHQVKTDSSAFRAALIELLTRANFQPLNQSDLETAFQTESVFKVKLHTSLDDFGELTLHGRGKRNRKETIKCWFGLRKRVINVDYFERVLLFVNFKPLEYFSSKKRKNLIFTPGSTILKLFSNVPIADLEMLFPNSEVRMKRLDQIIIGLPAILGIVTMSAKILVVLGFLWAGLKWIGTETGLHHEQVDVGKLAAEAGLVLAACGAIYIFINRQLMRYRFKKMQFIKALSDNLYFRNLDNNAGVFHRILDDAFEEEVKEAMLAYGFLTEGSSTAADLDAKIEAWFSSRLGTNVDFEIGDGLGKLERIGLASCSGTLWSALSPAEAALHLNEYIRKLHPII